MMKFSAEQRQKARNDVALARTLQPLRGEIDLQCQLNAAVELLRRTTRSPKPGERYPLWKAIQDFLSAFPEGGKDEQ